MGSLPPVWPVTEVGDRVNAMECLSSDAAKQGGTFIFDRRPNEVVNVDVDPVSGTIGFAAFCGFGRVHILFEAMRGKPDFVGDKVVTCFSCGT
jgi:hypothetical protein